MNNTNTIHPIEFALAVVLASVESLLWIINELAGFHSQSTPVTSTTPVQTTPQTALAAHTQALRASLVADLQGLTKRQLQTLTGLRSSRFNKADLLRIATENLAHTH